MDREKNMYRLFLKRAYPPDFESFRKVLKGEKEPEKVHFVEWGVDSEVWLHCCGNVLEIMDDLIEVVKIDAFHSFQDVIVPVGEFKKRYGNTIAILGGVDMDKLSRLEEQNLRNYVRGILDECMSGGRYALGSGNSIANYIPIENYLIMLEEGLRWKGK